MFGPNRGYVAEQTFAGVNLLYQRPPDGDELVWGIPGKGPLWRDLCTRSAFLPRTLCWV